MRFLKLVPLFLFAILLLGGCAKNPDTSATTAGQKFLTVTLNFRGAIDTTRASGGNYYYVVINRTDDINEKGPIPVVQGPPWGNGFAAPDTGGTQGFVGYVIFSRNQGAGSGQGGYGVYTYLQTDGTLQNPVTGQGRYIGTPDSFIVPQSGGSQLYFRLDLSRLPKSTAKYIQLNFISTDNIPQTDQNNAPKSWDALGDGRNTGQINNYLTIDTTTNTQLTNTTSGTVEPTGDVRDRLNGTVDDGSLDLSDWSLSISGN